GLASFRAPRSELWNEVIPSLLEGQLDRHPYLKSLYLTVQNIRRHDDLGMLVQLNSCNRIRNVGLERRVASRIRNREGEQGSITPHLPRLQINRTTPQADI